jgi:hypothetical protein
MGCTPSKKAMELEHVGELADAEVMVTADPDWASNGTYRVILPSGRSVKVGASLGKLSDDVGGAVILRIEEGGLFHQWNRSNPSITFEIGHIITEADGATGYNEILQRLGSPGAVKLLVQSVPPMQNWSSDASDSGSIDSASSSVSVRLFTHRRGRKVEDVFACLDEVSAGSCGVSECCVCLADVANDAKLVQLRCGHACHVGCASTWLLGPSGRCPLCLTTAFDSDKFSITRAPLI